MKLISELEEVNVIRIPRCVTSEANTKEFVYELEGFSDASSSAYAAVMYLVIKSQNSIQVLLIASKTRLAPLNKLIIPRLEILAALILARGVARIFQRGGHTVSNIIVMAFSPRNIVGCFLKKCLHRGGGSRAPQDPPRYALAGKVDCLE